MQSGLHSVELFVYFCVWTSANLYSLYKLFDSQNEILVNNENLKQSLHDLQPGWNFINRLKDVSDTEWSSWKFLMHTSSFFLIFQFVVTEVIRRRSMSLVKYWYILSSTIFILLHMGYKQLLLIFIQPLLYSVIILCGGNKPTIWITNLILLICYNQFKHNSFVWDFMDRENQSDEEVYLLLYCIAWVLLKCSSFSIDYIDKVKQQKTPSKTETVINMLSYILYLPLLYTGPVILYDDFEQSFCNKSEDLSVKLKRFVIDMSLYVFYTFLMDLSLHYIYFYAMQDEMQLIRQLPTLALCGGGLWMGLQFHLKYVIAYGTTTAFARLDNIDPPPTPRCIARVHVYSQMWRYFDVGLYRFLLKYIYKPCYAILSTVKLPLTIHKLSASLLTFLFIFLWHGTTKYLFTWTVLNFLGITLEYLSKAVAKHEIYLCFKRKILKTDAMETRFIALLCVPLLVLSAISNFYLFAGPEVGDLFFESFLHPSLRNSVIICTCLYCCCHVSMALENVHSRTDSRYRKLQCPIKSS